jgi:hypothetical protein
MNPLPAPYEPAGKPVKIEMKHTVTVSIHLYLVDQLNLAFSQYSLHVMT